MKHFKKRTIALVLASVITVAGSFANENYKNSLMGLSFETTTDNSVNMTLQTRSTFNGDVTPIRKDANTYILTLPEVNNLAQTPDLTNVSSNISSVNIRTMPYSSGGKGYTRITVKTNNPAASISAKSVIFIPKAPEKPQITTNNNNNYTKKREQERIIREIEQRRIIDKTEEEIIAEATPISRRSYDLETSDKPIVEEIVNTAPLNNKKYNEETDSNNIYLYLLALLIVLGSSYFYIKARNKMQEIAGENLNIDVDDDKIKKNNNKKRLTTLKNTIKTLDSTYRKGAIIPPKTEYSQQNSLKTNPEIDELNIVDLDELFQEHKTKKNEIETSDDENQALEDFLSGFSFDDENYEENIEDNSIGYNEELYKNIINNNELTFNNKDIECIKELLNTEINDDTIKNIEKYALTNPIKKTSSKQKMLEDLVSSYVISQNIIFTQDDIGIIKDLLSVEFDKDFITNLKTDPELTKTMEKEISTQNEITKKPSKIITLNVKDMLPDLSEALRQHGDRKIESNYKPQVIYTEESFELQSLTLNENLPDLSKEIYNKDAYISKPSAEIQYTDNNYEVATFNDIGDLPDLEDALKNPHKYTKEEVPVIIDEDALLKNISNVQFKPFYDGEEFEIINKFEDAPTVSDIQKEFSQFENFEITEESDTEPETIDKNIQDEDIYIDLDKKRNINSSKTEHKREEFVPLDLNQNITNKSSGRKSFKSSEELMRKIQETRVERELRKTRIMEQRNEKKSLDNNKNLQKNPTKCIIDNESYIIISSVILTENKECHLVKNDNGYAVLGCVNNKLIKLKQYESLKSEKIQARLNETLDNGISRYIVRIGLNKFLINVSEDNIEYVMDLC